MLFELLALKKPHLLVPLSRKASRGDQILNAQSFEQQGFSMVLQEESLNGKQLIGCVKQLYQQRGQFIDAMSGQSEGQAISRVRETFESALNQ